MSESGPPPKFTISESGGVKEQAIHENDPQYDKAVGADLMQAEEKQEEQKPVSLAIADEVTKIVDGDSTISVEITTNSETGMDTLTINGEEFFDALAQQFPSDVLDDFFLLTEDGKLDYKSGLYVEVSISHDPFQITKEAAGIRFLIKHEPFGFNNTNGPSGGVHSNPESEDDFSLRTMQVVVDPITNTPGRVTYTNLGRDGAGVQYTGSIHDDGTESLSYANIKVTPESRSYGEVAPIDPKNPEHQQVADVLFAIRGEFAEYLE